MQIFESKLFSFWQVTPKEGKKNWTSSSSDEDLVLILISKKNKRRF